MGIFDFLKKKEDLSAKKTIKPEQLVNEMPIESIQESEPSITVVIEQPSIFEQICQALDDQGRLPVTFELSNETSDNQLKYAPGAIDGIRIYHMAKHDGMTEAKEVYQLLKLIGEENSQDAAQHLSTYLKEHSVLSFVEELSQLFYQQRSEFPPLMLVRLAYDFMTKGNEVEIVKLGLALIGLLDVENNEECRSVILLLARYNEFTLFSVVAVSKWKNHNQILFNLAKEVHGWGKIHAIEHLSATTPEIKNWIICYGCENGVLDTYLGLTCANKGNIIEEMRQNEINDEILQGITLILTACFNEGPVPGISQYQHTAEAIDRYLFHLVNKTLSLDCIDLLLTIHEWLGNSELKSKSILAHRCLSIIQQLDCSEMILQTLNDAQSDQIWLACRLAEKLSIEINDLLIELMARNPLKYVSVICFICKAPEYAKQVFELYEQLLPLSEIATGTDELLGLGAQYELHNGLNYLLTELKEYCGQGIELVKTGLESPVISNRAAAAEVLLSWKKQSGSTINELNKDLAFMANLTLKTEPNREVKEKLSNLF